MTQIPRIPCQQRKSVPPHGSLPHHHFSMSVRQGVEKQSFFHDREVSPNFLTVSVAWRKSPGGRKSVMSVHENFKGGAGKTSSVRLLYEWRIKANQTDFCRRRVAFLTNQWNQISIVWISICCNENFVNRIWYRSLIIPSLKESVHFLL